MIKSFRCSETEKLFNREQPRKFPATIYAAALRKLWMLAAATTISDLRVPPANHLELLRGNRAGQHSIRINKKWRLCFVWKDASAYNVEVVDYH